MNELEIKRDKFDAAKKQLENLSKSIPISVELQSVPTDGGLFGWFNHSVTGIELNGLTAQIQKYLITLNDQTKKTVKGFDEVYKVLDTLDKEYIAGILTAVKAAEQASIQARDSASEAQKNSEDILKIIEVQTQTIDVLSKFKDNAEEQIKQLSKRLKNYKIIFLIAITSIFALNIITFLRLFY